MKIKTTAFIAVLLGQSTGPILENVNNPSDQAPACSGRVLRFITNEVSAANLDVSPEGRRLVFDLLGDIYIVKSTGGRASRITSGPGWDYRPVWSPDGKRIAFISDRSGNETVFVVDPDGRTDPQPVLINRALLQPHGSVSEGELVSAEWMPDSSGVVVQGVRFPISGGEIVEGTPIIDAYVNSSFGNARGLYLTVDRSNDNLSEPSGAGVDHAQLWKIRPGSIRPELVQDLSMSLGSAVNGPLISNDERWLVYSGRAAEAGPDDLGNQDLARPKRSDVVHVLDRKLGVERLLISERMSPTWRDNAPDNEGLSAPWRYAISPDSKFLYASYGGQIHRIDIASGENTIVPFRAYVDQCLAPIISFESRISDEPARSKTIRSASINLDGSKLVFSALKKIYVREVKNGKTHLLYPQQEGQFEPALSPDGLWVAFATWSTKEGGNIWRARTDIQFAEKLTTVAGYYRTPVWAPDGQSLIFVGSDDMVQDRPGFDVYTYKGTLRRLTISNHRIRELPQAARLGDAPVLSADGSRIFYVPYIDQPDNPVTLASVAIDGSKPQHESVGGPFPPGSGVTISVNATGDRVIVTKYGNVYLVDCRPYPESRFPQRCTEIKLSTDGGYDARWNVRGNQVEWTMANNYFRADVGMTESGQSTVAEDPAVSSDSPRLNIDLPLDVRIAPERAHGILVLKGARIITMRGSEVIDNGTVVIKDGRIADIGPLDTVDIPADAKVIDVEGKTIVPGFIDMHAHFTHIPRDIIPDNHWEPLIYLAYGVTTIRDPSNGGDHGFEYAELIDTGGMVGPRMLGATGIVPRRIGSIDNEDVTRSWANRYKVIGGSFLKNHTGWNRQQRKWIIDGADEYGMNVASHLPAANGSLSRVNLSTIADGVTTSEHTISRSSDLVYDVKKFVALSKVGLVFAAISLEGGYPRWYWSRVASDPRMLAFYRGPVPVSYVDADKGTSNGGLEPLRRGAEMSSKFLADVARMGGQVMIGSHGNFSGIGFHWEMWAHARGGLTSHQVLQAATLNGARSLGVESDLGSVEVGKLGDLLVLSKNPLDDIQNTTSIELVIKSGVVRDSKTLSELWPTSKALAPWELSRPNRDLGAIPSEKEKVKDIFH